MAVLTKTERLIQEAATGKSEFGTKVFNSMLEFYKTLDFLLDTPMHYNIIIFLYRRKHKGKTFEKIARTFNRSVSTLESNRRDYQKVFLYYYEKLKKQENSAA